MIYCHPVYGRGNGLGNRLFPWARCRVFAHLNHVQMLAPVWFRLSVGSLIRGGINPRAYLQQIVLAGLFTRGSDELGGRRRLRVLSTALKLSEPTDLRVPEGLGGTGDVLFQFRGDKRHFRDLAGWDQFLHRELRRITKRHWLHKADRFAGIPIGINVRAGKDFPAAKSPQDFFVKGPLRTPLAWFAESLRAIRRLIGYDAPALVVSDGSANQLQPLLRMKGVHFVRPGCAISDLLTLAKTRVLLASGASSFSAWAAFLGQMPTIAHPGQSLNWFGLGTDCGPYTCEFDPASPPAEFSERITRLFASRTADCDRAPGQPRIAQTILRGGRE